MRNILILEDDAATRALLCEVLRTAFADDEPVLHEAASLAQAEPALHDRHFDLALIDLHLPDGTGIDLLRRFKQRQPEALAVIVTIFDDDEHIFAGLQAGADGYLLKDQSTERLIQKIRGILRGEPPLSPAIARRVLRHFRAQASEPAPCEAALTGRETEVLTLLGKGLLNREIAELLDLKPSTVAAHIKSIYRKLDISSRAEAALEAGRRGLIDLDGWH